MKDFKSEPVENIRWLDANDLHANDWNPNVVFNAELKLLERSILEDGWIQPILVNKNLMIIDGFHRVSLARDSKKLKVLYGTNVPCSILDIDDNQAMLRTVRMNRAKGQHIAVRMSSLVQRLIQNGMSTKEIMDGIGATKTEVQLLLDGTLLKTRDLKNAKYSKAWVPVETSDMTKQEIAELEKSNQILTEDMVE